MNQSVPPDSSSPPGAPAGCCGEPAWRRDFPIDSAQDNYVARRDFTKFLVLTSLAFVVGQIWIAAQNLIRRRRGRPEIRKLIPLAEIAVGSTVTFHYPEAHDPCLLVRPEPGVLLAFSQVCTHLSCPVIPDVKENLIHCPCHHGVFDLASGRPIAGPPRRPLDRIEVEVRQGIVYATGIQRRTQ